jgi:hypothetical protein
MEDRVTMLPENVIIPLQEHVAHVKRCHAQDVAQGVGPMYLPFALERKYPHAGRLWIWHYAFPSDRLSKDPRTGIIRRQDASERLAEGCESSRAFGGTQQTYQLPDLSA